LLAEDLSVLLKIHASLIVDRVRIVSEVNVSEHTFSLSCRYRSAAEPTFTLGGKFGFGESVAVATTRAEPGASGERNYQSKGES
jgi:hypothetical protein